MQDSESKMVVAQVQTEEQDTEQRLRCPVYDKVPNAIRCQLVKKVISSMRAQDRTLVFGLACKRLAGS